MTIFRNINDGKLYMIYHVNTHHHTGIWYEVEPLDSQKYSVINPRKWARKQLRDGEVGTTYVPQYHVDNNVVARFQI